MKKIEVLGTGCAKCRKLEEQATLAANELGLDFQIDKIEDIEKIMTYGVMMTPALVVDGEVKVSGKVPSLNDIKLMLS